MRNQVGSRVITSFLCCALSGCAAKAYVGDVRSGENIAIAHYDSRFSLIPSRRVTVVSVDGIELSNAFSYSVELTPGFHTLKISFQDVRQGHTRVGTNLCWITAYFYAGREYQIESAMDAKNWQAWVQDKATEQTIDSFFTPPGREA